MKYKVCRHQNIFVLSITIRTIFLADHLKMMKECSLMNNEQYKL